MPDYLQTHVKIKIKMKTKIKIKIRSARGPSPKLQVLPKGENAEWVGENLASQTKWAA